MGNSLPASVICVHCAVEVVIETKFDEHWRTCVKHPARIELDRLRTGIEDVLVEANVGSLTNDGKTFEYLCGDCKRTATGEHEEGCIWGDLAQLLEPPK